MKCLKWSLMWVVYLATVTNGNAGQIASGVIIVDGAHYPPTELQFELRVCNMLEGWLPGPALFEGIVYGPDSVGAMAIANASTDSDFADVVGYLTNGVSEGFALDIVGQGFTSGDTEQNLFGLDSVDFHGIQIDWIAVRIDELLLETIDETTYMQLAATVFIGNEDVTYSATGTWGQLKADFR